MCVVKRISLSFSQYGQHGEEVSYIVKVKQPFADGLRGFSNMAFEKECLFYASLMPALNAELEAASLESLRLPVCYFYSLEENQEVLILEDLSHRRFTMADRKNGLDASHAELVFRELARIHASSFLLQAHLSSGNLEKEYKFLTKDWYNYSEEAEREIGLMLRSDVNMLVRIAEAAEGYEEVLDLLRNLAPKSMDVFKEQLKTRQPFAVFCHGDCWTNNFLFRYDSEGRPVEVMLLDLQLCRRGSLALDLNTITYTSLSGELRRAKLSHLLHTYLASFTDVLKARDITPPFTYDELLQEYRQKNLFGLLMGADYLCITLGEAIDAPDYTQVGSGDEEWMRQREEQVLGTVGRNPLLLAQICTMFDDVAGLVL